MTSHSSFPDVRWIDVLIPDMWGIPRGKRLDASAMEKVLTTGIVLPGSTYAMDMQGNNVESTGVGFTDGDPDYPCQAVAETLALVPWLGLDHAQVMLSMSDAADRPWWLDPRHIVQRMATSLGALGYRARVAFELEFYLVERDRDGTLQPAPPPGSSQRPSETQVYLMDDVEAYGPVLGDMVTTCRRQNIPADVITMEYAPAQFEINLHYGDDPLTACDHAFLMKRAIKAVARSHGMTATFMARPFGGLSASGTHVHISLLDDEGRNVFDDGSDEGSDIMRHAVAGLAATMAEAMPIWAPGANSYRRLAPGGWVSLAASWGYNNRDMSLRIPGGAASGRRIEHRAAGADANPYLVLAAILAGLNHGLSNRLDPGPPASADPAALPVLWVDALRSFDQAEVLPGYFTPEWWKVYSALAWSEFHTFNGHVTTLEHDRFLTLV